MTSEELKNHLTSKEGLILHLKLLYKETKSPTDATIKALLDQKDVILRLTYENEELQSKLKAMEAKVAKLETLYAELTHCIGLNQDEKRNKEYTGLGFQLNFIC